MRGFKSSGFGNLLLATLMLVVELTVYPYGLELAALKTSQNLKRKLNIMNRKNFLKWLFGCSAVCAFPISSNAKINTDNELLKEKGRYIYRRYVAEKYIDQVVGEITDETGHYFYAMPVGYVKTPNGAHKEPIEIPVKYRRSYSDKYNIYVREELVRNLIAFFETRKTGTFLDRI